MHTNTSEEWAQLIFGNANLGDPRRTRRLALLASDMAENADSSIVKASDTPAKIEAAYRFIRNEKISPQAIAYSGFSQTSEAVKQLPLVLAIQDTTGLTFKHSVCKELGDVNCTNTLGKPSKTRTLYAHSTLAIDADTEHVIGLLDQYYWFRKSKVKGTKDQQQQRPYEEKESYRWQQTLMDIKKRTGELSNILNICDREADIYEYMTYQKDEGHRFLVRAKENRKLIEPQCNLNQLIETAQGQCCYTINIAQRAGRKARQARITLSVNVIVCQEKESTQKNPLCWILYMTEPVNTAEDAQKLVRYYELRWRVEEFHKTWKTDGTEVEDLRLQHSDNILRIAIIKAFIAVRLLQLQNMAQRSELDKEVRCTTCVKEMTWKLLWAKVEKDVLPDKVPSLHWLYYSLAKLGGWYDSKRNGRVGVKALWKGWLKLAEMVESAELLISIQQTEKL
ncbi:IS4 family transposase [Pseudoalteromonas sp. 1_2015MBL_MicDiv]|uniref:IS4 family transposase n=1 Tax=Pseudoalteromonas sp. 1_2015MBL_MicDiv TaxID=1720343 RepID=UPI000BBEDD4D|nr:IS4 family transposase [Pseudoalteromonas sp. 1_2015MBL_MicDiv]ATG80003.1 hypothetical protein AOR04_20980 [Pseudoalteromonas sp. 1_2015MBL_MicDiv]